MAAQRIGWGNLLARILAATVGAYALCYAWVAALVLLLPRTTRIDGIDATIFSTSGAFLLFVAIILRAFSIRSIARGWAELALATGVALVAIWIVR
jgi:hypothetical protein